MKTITNLILLLFIVNSYAQDNKMSCKEIRQIVRKQGITDTIFTVQNSQLKKVEYHHFKNTGFVIATINDQKLNTLSEYIYCNIGYYQWSLFLTEAKYDYKNDYFISLMKNIMRTKNDCQCTSD